MSNSNRFPSNHPKPRRFSPDRLRLAIIGAITLVAVPVLGSFSPLSLLFVVPLFGLVLALAAFLNSGLILSQEGIEWYALHPRWRFRKIPWHAVHGVQWSLFGLLHPVCLSVAPGKYEWTVWGDPARGRSQDIEIWPRAIARGAEVFPAIKEWLAWRDGAGTLASPSDQAA